MTAQLADKDVWVQVEKVGTHPEKREQAMLVQVVVYDLLLIFRNNGWVWSKVDCMGCRIPNNAAGKDWREKNVALACGSDQLFAPVDNPDDLEIVVVRGSHTTVLIRCIKSGKKGIHPETM